MAHPPLGGRMLPMRAGKGESMQITVIGIDLGQNICSLAGLDTSGQVMRTAGEISPSVWTPKPTSATSCPNALARCVRTTLATLIGQIVVKTAKMTIFPKQNADSAVPSRVHVAIVGP